IMFNYYSTILECSTTLLYTLSLHDALPISSYCEAKENTGYDRCGSPLGAGWVQVLQRRFAQGLGELGVIDRAGQHQSEASLKHRSEEHTSELQSRFDLVCRLLLENKNDESW